MRSPLETTSHDTPFDLNHFFELSADLFCIAGYDGYFQKVNSSVCKTLGYSEAELMQKKIEQFIHPDDRTITAKHRHELINGEPLLNFENRYITKDGSIVWLAWTSMPVNKDQRVYAIAKNITYKKKLEEDRNKLLANLTKVNSDLKQLTFTTSHDLRSPVNNLLSVFKMLNVSKIDDEETLRFLSLFKNATESLSNTLNNYVDALDKKEGLRVQLMPITLEDSFTHIKQSLQALIQDSKTTFDTDFSAAPVVHFNPSYLDSIFLNLITNSIKYARPDRDPVITIRSNKKDGFVELVFSDNGLGFDEEKVKDKLFGFHQTFHQHADSKGIGLYLVYNHITSLGGNIHFQGQVNEGASFILHFKEPH